MTCKYGPQYQDSTAALRNTFERILSEQSVWWSESKEQLSLPEARLAVALMGQRFMDLIPKRPSAAFGWKPEHMREAKAFFFSEDGTLGFWAGLLGLDFEWVRELVQNFIRNKPALVSGGLNRSRKAVAA